MTQRLDAVFSPKITLYWRGYFGKFVRNWYADTRDQQLLLRQFMTEAGIPRGVNHISDGQYDLVLAAAGKFGYCLETVGDPETDTTRNGPYVPRKDPDVDNK